ncbi:MAG TPA: glycosyl hydrolase, partial [Chitinophagaceae bacterium]|nr:glycosyl hydrolase [Chitinophagaceae bacterium]
HDTWAEQAGAWTDYLARSSYLLQQGKFVADVVYYYGEDNNITALFGAKLPDVPSGYSFDFINAHALIHLLSVKDGRLVTPSGMSYRVLVLDSNARKMSLPVLRKIAQLVKGGAASSGVKPERIASLTDDPQEFRRLVAEVWSASSSPQTAAGKKVYTGKNLTEVLRSLNIEPDFSYRRQPGGPELLYVHRRLTDGEVYWVNSRSHKFDTVEVSFRTGGRVPEIWHPESGRSEPASYRIEDGRTTVRLNLAPQDAVFVVFRKVALQTTVTLPAPNEQVLAQVEGPWTVAFQPERGAPATARFDRLVSFTENKDTGIKYFSGTATYTKSIEVPGAALGPGASLWLDLGAVGHLAEVIVNGRSVGVVWKQPFRVEVTGALKSGSNELAIKVTNLWVNRLIGDKQPGVTHKFTYTTFPYYKAGSPLQPSGLLGPVRLFASQ